MMLAPEKPAQRATEDAPTAHVCYTPVCRYLCERGDIMKFLLTSAGIKNTSIHDALINLLGKPIAESNALCIPTAIYPFPGGPSMAYRFISGSTASPMCEL